MADFPVEEALVNTANPAQLHDEARGTLVKWPASFAYVGGRWVYRVDRDDLTKEQEAKVATAIANHVPNPRYGRHPDDLALADLHAKASWTAADVATAAKLLVKRAVT